MFVAFDGCSKSKLKGRPESDLCKLAKPNVNTYFTKTHGERIYCVDRNDVVSTTFCINCKHARR